MSAAYVQLELRESAASIRVRLLIKCGFYTRLYGMLFLCMCICDSVRACRGGYFELFNFLAGISQYSTVSIISVLLLFLLSALALGLTGILRV